MIQFNVNSQNSIVIVYIICLNFLLCRNAYPHVILIINFHYNDRLENYGDTLENYCTLFDNISLIMDIAYFYISSYKLLDHILRQIFFMTCKNSRGSTKKDFLSNLDYVWTILSTHRI